MKYSIIMTVHDREPEILLSTVRSLSRCDLTDCEVVIVNDRSVMGYEWLREVAAARLPCMVWKDIEPYEAFELDGGFRNPARAFNVALLEAKGENICIMSSDVLISPVIMQRVRRFNLADTAWTPLIIDIESNSQYCGPARLFPAPWFLCANRQICLDIGGWDETYLRGMCYEDNDFMGRLFLKTGRFIGDWTVIAYHQSHDQPAYRFVDPMVHDANQRNHDYTKKKWGGIPFCTNYTPFDMLRKPWITGDVAHECRYEGTLLEDVIERTTGIVADLRVKA